MSNASLKEQLQAVASQLSDSDKAKLSIKDDKLSNVDHVSNKDQISKDKINKEHRQEHKPIKKFHQPIEKPKKPKPKWLDYAQYGVELLRAYFPCTFKAPNQVQPLKKGIKQDLVMRLSTLEGIVTDDKACMVKSLAYYVNTVAYHKSVVAGATRIDLDGNSADIVTAEEAQYSIDRQQAKIQTKQTVGLQNQQPQPADQPQ